MQIWLWMKFARISEASFHFFCINVLSTWKLFIFARNYKSFDRLAVFAKNEVNYSLTWENNSIQVVLFRTSFKCTSKDDWWWLEIVNVVAWVGNPFLLSKPTLNILHKVVGGMPETPCWPESCNTSLCDQLNSLNRNKWGRYNKRILYQIENEGAFNRWMLLHSRFCWVLRSTK